MEVLIDTHVFLWYFTADPRMSTRAVRILNDTDNRVYLSLASIWEIVIKAGKGKLDLPAPAGDYILARLDAQGIQSLPIHLTHILRLSGLLNDIHRDPFNSLLAAQSLVEGIPVLTGDSAFRRYGVKTIW